MIEREVYFIAAPDFAAVSEKLVLPSPHFAALLVADSTTVEAQTLGRFAGQMLQSGCSYFCAWGPGCERAHDCFDEECLFTPSVIMTTWHADEPLDEALWFFLRNSWPVEAFFDTTGSAVAITIGNADWAAHVERRLRDIPTLVDDVLQAV